MWFYFFNHMKKNFKWRFDLQGLIGYYIWESKPYFTPQYKKNLLEITFVEVDCDGPSRSRNLLNIPMCCCRSLSSSSFVGLGVFVLGAECNTWQRSVGALLASIKTSLTVLQKKRHRQSCDALVLFAANAGATSSHLSLFSWQMTMMTMMHSAFVLRAAGPQSANRWSNEQEGVCVDQSVCK